MLRWYPCCKHVVHSLPIGLSKEDLLRERESLLYLFTALFKFLVYSLVEIAFTASLV